VKIWHKVLIR